MIIKYYSRTDNRCRVTFKLSAEHGAERATLVGTFNEWNRTAQPMERLDDGSFTLSLWLEPERKYHFRYLLDGERWVNDEEADGYEQNPYGSDDCVVNT